MRWTADEFEQIAADIGLHFDGPLQINAASAPRPVCRCFIERLLKLAYGDDAADA